MAEEDDSLLREEAVHQDYYWVRVWAVCREMGMESKRLGVVCMGGREGRDKLNE